MTAKIEKGQLGIVNIDGEDCGVTALRVAEDAFRDGVNWIDVKLEQGAGKYKRGDIVSSYPDAAIEDEHEAGIVPAKALIMRSDRGELGVDRICVGSGLSIEEALADTLARFESGETAHFADTPEAVKGLEANGSWNKDSYKVTYYIDFYRR